MSEFPSASVADTLVTTVAPSKIKESPTSLSTGGLFVGATVPPPPVLPPPPPHAVTNKNKAIGLKRGNDITDPNLYFF